MPRIIQKDLIIPPRPPIIPPRSRNSNSFRLHFPCAHMRAPTLWAGGQRRQSRPDSVRYTHASSRRAARRRRPPTPTHRQDQRWCAAPAKSSQELTSRQIPFPSLPPGIGERVLHLLSGISTECLNKPTTLDSRQRHPLPTLRSDPGVHVRCRHRIRSEAAGERARWRRSGERGAAESFMGCSCRRRGLAASSFAATPRLHLHLAHGMR